MKIGDRVLVHLHPFVPHIAPTLGIVTRVHPTGWVDVTMFPDMDTIRDLSYPTVKAAGPMRVTDKPETILNYRGGYIAVPLDPPFTVAPIEAGSCTTIAAPPTVNHSAHAVVIDAPRPKPHRTPTR